MKTRIQLGLEKKNSCSVMIAVMLAIIAVQPLQVFGSFVSAKMKFNDYTSTPDFSVVLSTLTAAVVAVIVFELGIVVFDFIVKSSKSK